MNSIWHCRWYGKRFKQKYSSQNVFNLQNNVYFSIKHILIVIIPLKTCADPERAPWVPYPAPWKITKLYDSLAPLENHKAFNVGPCSTRQRKAIRLFKWCFADRPMMAHLKWYWDHQLKKKIARVGAVWPPFWMCMEEVLTVYLEDGLYVIRLINAYMSSNNKAKSFNMY